jgi:dihydropteroate synthase
MPTALTETPRQALKTSGTLIMGIVNVTPDSFSDGGKFLDPKAAIEQAYRLVEEGADILDIGAESTRPGAEYVSAEDEWRRLEPVLRELCQNSPVPISVDTYKSSVAARAIELGIDIINDIWGGLADADMLNVVAQAKCGYIWMHNREHPVQENAFDALVHETRAGIERCLASGIDKALLWIDPGIGFGKTYHQNLSILRRLSEYCALGYPVLLGTSRKSVIGNTLNVPPADRLEGSLATAVLGVAAGVRCIRVHDVRATVRACRMTEAILQADE